MIHSKEPPFVKALGAAWANTAHISNRQDVHKYMTGNVVLIGFDLEGWAESVNEIGLAIIRTGTDKALQPFEDGDLDAFHDKNALMAHTIRIKEHTRNRGVGVPKIGAFAIVPEHDIERKLSEMILACRTEGARMILVGYSMNTEFDWMAYCCPSLLSLFDAWVDVQELVETECQARPSLARLMAHFAGQDPAQVSKSTHRAAVDAVKILAALSKFMGHRSIGYTAPRSIKLCSHKPAHWARVAFRARIWALNGEHLPVEWSSPRAFAQQFQNHDLKVVYIDAAKMIGGRAIELWMSTDTEADLNACVADVKALLVGRQKVLTDTFIADWVIQARKKIPEFRV